MSAKVFKFINATAKKAFLSLPDEVRKQFAADLQAVQSGKPPFSAFKDISASVGAGSIELIENGSPAYRVVYCAKFLNTVYILHAFTKTCNGVDQAAMKTAAKRFKDMTAEVAALKKLEKQQGKHSKAVKSDKLKKNKR